MAKESMFKNIDLIPLLILGLFLAGIYAVMKKCSSTRVNDTQSPLPSGMYTSGSVNNGMDVARRVNFQQQPVGGPTWG